MYNKDLKLMSVTPTIFVIHLHLVKFFVIQFGRLFSLDLHWCLDGLLDHVDELCWFSDGPCDHHSFMIRSGLSMIVVHRLLHALSEHIHVCGGLIWLDSYFCCNSPYLGRIWFGLTAAFCCNLCYYIQWTWSSKFEIRQTAREYE